MSIKSKDDERAISMNNQAERIVSIGYIQFSPALGNVSATKQHFCALPGISMHAIQYSYYFIYAFGLVCPVPLLSENEKHFYRWRRQMRRDNARRRYDHNQRRRAEEHQRVTGVAMTGYQKSDAL